MLAAVYEPTGISGTVAHILQEINLAFIATLFFAQLPGGGTGGRCLPFPIVSCVISTLISEAMSQQ